MSKTIDLGLKYPCYACYHNDVRYFDEPCSICKRNIGVIGKAITPTDDLVYDEIVYKEDKFELIRNPSSIVFAQALFSDMGDD